MSAATEAPLLKARLERIRRLARPEEDWRASLLKWGTPRLEEDHNVTYSFLPRVTVETMEPYLQELSRRVGFPIKGEYETPPTEETRNDQAAASVTPPGLLEIEQRIRVGTLPPDTRLSVGGISLSRSELPEHSISEKTSSSRQSERKAKGKTAREGVPMDIRASASFRALSRNAQGILKVMYGLSGFHRSTSSRTCKVSRSGLAKLHRVTPRTVTNVWNDMERRFLVRRLRRGGQRRGISVFELPCNYSHVRWWRMEAAGKKRY